MSLDAYVGIYSGYSLDGTSITGSALDPYVDDALTELEVCRNRDHHSDTCADIRKVHSR